MEDQDKFLEMLEEVKGIAKAQGGTLTERELKEYLRGMTFSEEQWDAIYQYLTAHHIRIEGKEDKPKGITPKALSEGERQEILRFLQGETAFRDRIIEKWVVRVKKLAKRYQNRSALRDEVIAEGNLGLMNGMAVVEADLPRYLLEDGTADLEAFLGTLNMEIIQAMEQYIDQSTEDQDQETTMLAKMNLLHEAAKYMTEEIGRVPTTEELSEYTKVPREEIGQMMGLSEDAKRVASPDVR